jgi:hypothetical protein
MKLVATKKMGIKPESLFKSKLAPMRHFRPMKAILDEEKVKKAELRKKHAKNFMKLKFRQTKQEVYDDKHLLVVDKDTKDPYKHYGLLVVEQPT